MKEGGSLPDELIALRRVIYGEETGFLEENQLVGPNDVHGCHVLLSYDDGTGPRLVGATHAVEADLCDFAEHSGLDTAALARGVYMTRTLIAPDFRQNGLYSTLLYLSLQDFRVAGRDILYAFMLPGDTQLRDRLRYEFIDGVPPRVVTGRGGKTYELHATWGTLSYGMHRVWKTIPADLQAFLCTQGFLADEVEATVTRRLESFYRGPWLQALGNRTLAKHHYVTTLANMHQFVRWTTRILAKVVGMTPDASLRRHYIQHMKGEIDHERWIENDLGALGADVDYVVNDMVALPAVRKFMALQESLCAFRQDPVLFLAIPIAVEGLSARLPEGSGRLLFEAVASWGIADPRKATTFLGSHAHTDGGDEGHWEKTREMIARLVVSDKQMQEFLGVIHAVMDAQDEMYASYVSAPSFIASENRAAGKSAA